METASFILVLDIGSLLLELVILFFVLRRQVASRLKRFVDATTHIAEGDFDIKMDARQDDELGRLAESFNTMAQTISSRDRELGQRRDQLESQVAQRTKDLEKTLNDLEEARQNSEAANRLSLEAT